MDQGFFCILSDQFIEILFVLLFERGHTSIPCRDIIYPINTTNHNLSETLMNLAILSLTILK